KLIYSDGIEADLRDPLDPASTPIQCDDLGLVYLKEFTIKSNDNEITPVSIKNNGAYRGTYIIDVKVTYLGSTAPYGGVQKVYVKSI
ncbi:hypothetical protein KY308_01905, partial [Candidatus Woesearchaeota archaeon]|nr:hypothetical protein [Candidatus Woesearchaeota archaeon]